MAFESTSPDPLADGWAALAEGDWEGARTRFEESLAEGENPEALEGLGWVGHVLDDDRLTFDSRERAYRLYRQGGEAGSAARVAAWHAFDCLAFRGEPAVANGWLQRAHSLLDELEPGPDHGWLAFHEGHIAVSLEEDTATARRLATRAVKLAREFGLPELEMLGLGLEGRALVSEGELEEGMRRLDEAAAAALAGEAKLLVCVAWACCYMIAACERVRDVDRAGQWCARVGEFCEQHGIGLLLGFCRAHHGAVLTWQGRWEEAERALRAAADELAASRPPAAGDALVRLAELRRRQGRLDEAVIEPAFGEVIAGPLYGEEGIVAAECDPRVGLRAKRWFDVVGHYGREDVLARTLAVPGAGRDRRQPPWAEEPATGDDDPPGAG